MEQKQILDALEESNRAFEAFKGLNEQRLALVEKGVGGIGDLTVQMEKAFKAMQDLSLIHI